MTSCGAGVSESGKLHGSRASVTRRGLSLGRSSDWEVKQPTQADWLAWWELPEIQWAAHAWTEVNKPCTPDATCLAINPWGTFVVKAGGCSMTGSIGGTFDQPEGSLPVSYETQDRWNNLLPDGGQKGRWDRRP